MKAHTPQYFFVSEVNSLHEQISSLVKSSGFILLGITLYVCKVTQPFHLLPSLIIHVKLIKILKSIPTIFNLLCSIPAVC